MKILFVAMSDSIHTVKWIKQLEGTGWKVYLYPSRDIPVIHKDMPRFVKVLRKHHRLYRLIENSSIHYSLFTIHYYLTRIEARIKTNYHERRLARLIAQVRPDLIHTLETQGAGYLVDQARLMLEKNGKIFPKWWHSNWGSDLMMFGQFPEHRVKIESVLSHCDYYSCECSRDVDLARKYGFKGEVFPVYPSAVGFSMDELEGLRSQTVPPSQRKVILLKGYQSWYSRAQVALRALELCKEMLEGYRLVVYSNSVTLTDLKINLELFSIKTGMPVEILPPQTPNQEMLRYQGMARMAIGLSMCDGISTAVLESMAMGAFPIQSDTSCAGEWFNDGVSGFLVPPEDPEVIAEKIKEALTRDDLVDAAVEINFRVIAEKANSDKNREISLASYQRIFSNLQS